MNMYKKILSYFLAISALFVPLMLSACKPSIGTPWYPRSASDNKRPFYIGEITVSGIAVTPEDASKNFNETASYFVSVPNGVKEIDASKIKVKLFTNAEQKEEITDYQLEIAGNSVPLITGTPVPVVLRIKPTARQYAVTEKAVKITRLAKNTVHLGSLSVAGIKAAPAADFAASGAYTVTVPHQISQITAEQISVELFADAEKQNRITEPSISVAGAPILLAEGIAIPVSVKITPTDPYAEMQTTVKITRELPEETEITAYIGELTVGGISVDLSKLQGEIYNVTVPASVKRITAKDIVLTLFADQAKTAPITEFTIRLFAGQTVHLAGGVPVYIAFEIQTVEPALKLTKIIKITREKPENIGGGENTDEEILEDDPNNQSSPDTLPKPQPPFDPNNPNSNPKDAQGNSKWIYKQNDPYMDPFEYYDENSFGFSASKFDDWVLNMPSMSGIIASYKFIEGSWSGTPETWNNQPDTIGSGLSAISNVKIYRYKTRAERWADHGGYVPAADPNDSRFYFYRFTANASGGIKPDNSMFCVDRYSKFLFYYSEPSYLKDIFGNKVPEAWMDYAAPTTGDHIHFEDPFYMSDPVGYVNSDGSVVLYQWIKDNINASDYHAKKNPNYTKPAERSAGKPGHSPYRGKVKTPPEGKWVQNPAYTAAPVHFSKQPKAQSVMKGAKDWFVQVVPKAVPFGEELSYQWYVNSSASNTGGTAISANGTDSAYLFPTNEVGTKYYYCKVINTNTKNGKTAEAVTEAVSVEVKDYIPVINFKCNSEHGSLTATVNGTPIESGAEVPIGQTVSFTAEPKEGYVVDYWLGAEHTDPDKKTASLLVSKNSHVRVVFRDKNAPPSGAFIVQYLCDTDKGTLTAEMDGVSLENNPAGVTVEKGKTITFKAEPNEGYEIDRWVGAVGTGKTAVLTVKQTEFVTVIFKKKLYKIDFSVQKADDGQLHGGISAKTSGQEISAGTVVEKDKLVTFTAIPEAGYEVASWQGDGLTVYPDKLTAVLTVSGETAVQVSFKKQPERVKVNLNYDSTKGHLSAFCDGKLIQSDEMVEKGKIIYFIAEPFAGNRVDDWAGLLQNDVSSDKRRAIARTDSDLAITVSFIKREQMRLTIRPKIYNESLRSWSTADGDHFNHKYTNGVHLGHKISAQVQADTQNIPGNWDKMIAVENNGGKWLRVTDNDFIGIKKEKLSNEAIIDENVVSFSNLKIALTPYLHKANRHDYWYAEWTALGGGDVYPLQALDDNSSFPLTYNEVTGYWTVDAANVQIKKSDDIELPAEYAGTQPDPNRRISYKGVTVTYDPNFTLADGEEKDFVITYEVNNPDTKSEGIIKVIYTIGWK